MSHAFGKTSHTCRSIYRVLYSFLGLHFLGCAVVDSISQDVASVEMITVSLLYPPHCAMSPLLFERQTLATRRVPEPPSTLLMLKYADIQVARRCQSHKKCYQTHTRKNKTNRARNISLGTLNTSTWPHAGHPQTGDLVEHKFH